LSIVRGLAGFRGLDDRAVFDYGKLSVFFKGTRKPLKAFFSEIFVKDVVQRKETHFNGNCMKFTRWFHFFFLFIPKLGEGEPNLTSIFFKWVETTN